jgi:predicted DNA binding CopG/RHH family protein
MKKKFPKLKTDKASESFVDEADLTQYDLSGMKPVSFEFQPKDKSITMRLRNTV